MPPAQAVTKICILTVMKGPFTQNLLGRCVAKRMGLVMRIDAVNTEVFSNIYGDVGILNCEPVKTELKPDAEPFGMATPWRTLLQS